MDDLYKNQEPEMVAETEPEIAPPEEMAEPFVDAKPEKEVETPPVSGTVHISEDVIMELARKLFPPLQAFNLRARGSRRNSASEEKPATASGFPWRIKSLPTRRLMCLYS